MKAFVLLGLLSLSAWFGIGRAQANDFPPCVPNYSNGMSGCNKETAYSAADAYWSVDANVCVAAGGGTIVSHSIYLVAPSRWKGTARCYRAAYGDYYNPTGGPTWYFDLPGCPGSTVWSDATHTCRDTSINLDKNLGPSCSLGNQAQSNLCGNPINVAIGNKYQREDDLRVSPLLGFSRYYNSLATATANLLGPGWTHSYTRSVEYVDAGAASATAIVSRPEGNRIKFREVGEQWQPDADVVAKLVRIDGAGGELLGWTYTSSDDRQVEQYDTLGRLLQIDKADGTAVNLTYNNGVIENNANDFRLTRVEAQDGRSLTFGYDASGRIGTITDAGGAVYTYGYDAAGNLATVTYPGGASRTYLYNEPAYTSGAALPHALTGIVHEDNQRFATFRYAADGRAISTEHAGGVEKFVVQYNTDGTSVVTTPAGATQRRAFDTVLGVKKATSVVETCADCGP